jgi:hypothetical protein
MQFVCRCLEEGVHEHISGGVDEVARASSCGKFSLDAGNELFSILSPRLDHSFHGLQAELRTSSLVVGGRGAASQYNHCGGCFPSAFDSSFFLAGLFL